MNGAGLKVIFGNNPGNQDPSARARFCANENHSHLKKTFFDYMINIYIIELKPVGMRTHAIKKY